MFRPSARSAAALLCLWLAACGGDDSENHAALVDECVQHLETGVGLLASADDSKSAKAAAAKIGSLTGEFRSLTEKARSLGAPSAEQKDALTQKLYATWEPAMGKLHAASLAILKDQNTAPILAPALTELDSAVKETDLALLESLGSK